MTNYGGRAKDIVGRAIQAYNRPNYGGAVGDAVPVGHATKSAGDSQVSLEESGMGYWICSCIEHNNDGEKHGNSIVRHFCYVIIIYMNIFLIKTFICCVNMLGH